MGRGGVSAHFKIEKNTNNNLNFISLETWFSRLGWKSELSLKVKVEKKHCEIMIQSL